MIPGSNLLGAAMRIVGRQTVIYHKATGRTTSPTGRDVTKYARPVKIFEGSFQPMSGTRVARSGLDTQKTYATWWVAADVLGVDRDISGDCVEYGGKRYQCQSVTDWFGQDGWKEVICVKVGNA